MATNYPGEYTARFLYTTTPATFAPLQHTMELNFNLFEDAAPGDPASGLHPLYRDGTHIKTLDDVVIEWATLLADCFSSAGGATIDAAEIWKYEAGTFVADFITAVSIAFAGTRVATPVVNSQMIMSFRTTEGGIAKLSLLETPNVAGAPDSPPYAEAGLDALADAFIDGTFPWVGRDNGFPFVSLRLFPGQNEALFKKRLRP